MKVSATQTPSGVKRDLDAERSSDWPIQPLPGVERGQRDAGDRGGQRERQVDERVDERRPGKS